MQKHNFFELEVLRNGHSKTVYHLINNGYIKSQNILKWRYTNIH